LRSQRGTGQTAVKPASRSTVHRQFATRAAGTLRYQFYGIIVRKTSVVAFPQAVNPNIDLAAKPPYRDPLRGAGDASRKMRFPYPFEDRHDLSDWTETP
jgi:hypothetical protein